ncbi:hypothetical protein NIES2100_01340 [Calothrix sp. NIES-2100]|nr:hypothetical protein NIES2100_01340 [Calothrix sp. NIES-2100]
MSPKSSDRSQASAAEKELSANLSLGYLGVLQKHFPALKTLLLSTNDTSMALKIL